MVPGGKTISEIKAFLKDQENKRQKYDQLKGRRYLTPDQNKFMIQNRRERKIQAQSERFHENRGDFDIGFEEPLLNGCRVSAALSKSNEDFPIRFEVNFGKKTALHALCTTFLEDIAKTEMENDKLLSDSEKYILIINYVNQTFDINAEDAKSILSSPGLPDGDYPFDALIDQKVGACVQKSILLKVLADKMDLKTALNSGVYIRTGKGYGHAWNTAKIDDKIYLVDVHHNKFEPLTDSLLKKYKQGELVDTDI